MAFLAPGTDAEELSLQVAVLDADPCPRRRDQGGLEPRTALADAGRASFTCALVIAWAETGPGYEMTTGGEARHVVADLRHDDIGDDVTHPGHRRQQSGARSDRLQGFSHATIDPGERGIERVDKI